MNSKAGLKYDAKAINQKLKYKVPGEIERIIHKLSSGGLLVGPISKTDARLGSTSIEQLHKCKAKVWVEVK